MFPPISSEARPSSLARLDASEVAAPSSGSVNGKAWVNQMSGDPTTVPTIWVTNRIEQIDPAFRRRFAIPSGTEVAATWRARRCGGARRWKASQVSAPEFVSQTDGKRKGLTPAQIRTAVRFAKLASDEPTGVGPLIERQLANADKALGNAPTGKPARPAVTNYDLGLINVECRYEIPKVVEALRRRGLGSLCFHGAPGTGKTALAEHIAHEIGMPLMIRQASDLVSKFVGETEQNMAKMFEEATREKAVLLLDEADSFLRSRRMAERSYEVTEVNEMLQGMERFPGIFICTTNLFEDLDEAALRRFTFKIKFQPLKPEQRVRMFVSEALEGDDTRLTAEQEDRLKLLDVLAPGDFAAVKRQVDVLGAPLEPDEFLSQLEAEHRVKPEVRQRRGIGFLH